MRSLMITTKTDVDTQITPDKWKYIMEFVYDDQKTLKLIFGSGNNMISLMSSGSDVRKICEGRKDIKKTVRQVGRRECIIIFILIVACLLRIFTY